MKPSSKVMRTLILSRRKPDDRATLVEMNRIVFLLDEDDLALEFCGRQRIGKRSRIRQNVVVDERLDLAAIPMSQRRVDAHKMNGLSNRFLKLAIRSASRNVCNEGSEWRAASELCDRVSSAGQHASWLRRLAHLCIAGQLAHAVERHGLDFFRNRKSRDFAAACGPDGQ